MEAVDSLFEGLVNGTTVRQRGEREESFVDRYVLEQNVVRTLNTIGRSFGTQDASAARNNQKFTSLYDKASPALRRIIDGITGEVGFVDKNVLMREMRQLIKLALCQLHAEPLTRRSLRSRILSEKWRDRLPNFVRLVKVEMTVNGATGRQ